MPDEKMWNDFFDIDLILSELQINSQIKDLVEIGIGYGTFTIPQNKLRVDYTVLILKKRCLIL